MLNFKYLGKIKPGFENIVGYDLGAQVGSIDVKPEVEDITHYSFKSYSPGRI
jgi:hypothetical protein